MAQRRFRVPKGRKAEVLTTAFYRFLEIHSRTTVDDDGLCSIRTEFDGSHEVKVLSFWSERAASEFLRFWEDFCRVYAQPEDFGDAASARPPRSRPSGKERATDPARAHGRARA